MGHSTKRLNIDANAMASFYRDGAKISTLARHFRCSPAVVDRRLRSVGVVRRTISESNRRHAVNHEYFSIIDSEHKAYWLGFLLADGCIRTGSNVLTVNLQASDAEHLRLFRDAIQSTAPIASTQKGKFPGVSFTACSVAMSRDLRSLGIVANAKRCCVPNGLERHFWRGVVDGDGCLVTSTARRKCGSTKTYAHLALCGTEETVSKFANYANQVCGTRVSATKRPGTDLWVCVLHGMGGSTMAKILYENNTVALSRKADAARALTKLGYRDNGLS